MKKNVKQNLFFLILIFLAFVSCKKKESDYITKNEDFITQGYVHVKLDGYSNDSIRINDSFTANLYNRYMDAAQNKATISSLNDSITDILFTRYANYFNETQISIGFQYNSKSKKVSFEAISAQFFKKIDNNSVLSFYGIYTPANNDTVFTDIVFSSETGVVSGKFNADLNKTLMNDQKFVNAKGDFNVKLNKIER